MSCKSCLWDEAVDALGDHLGLYMLLKKQPQQDGETENPGSTAVSTVSGKRAKVPFQDLTQGRIIGTGQFGAVRIVQHKNTGETFALKVQRPAMGCEASMAMLP